MARIMLNMPNEDNSGALNVYVEDGELVFSMEPYDPEEHAWLGGRVRIPVDQFRSLLDQLLNVKPVR